VKLTPAQRDTMKELADQGGIDRPEGAAVDVLDDLVEVGLAEERVPKSGARTSRGPFRATAKGRAVAARLP
jgi:DNA-binding PadR family transcriptional regulator